MTPGGDWIGCRGWQIPEHDSGTASLPRREGAFTMSRGKRKLRPVLDGEFWMIGDNPDLGAIQGPWVHPKDSDKRHPQECVDHHIHQSADGAWHLWGCIRGTAVGRVLYRWEGESLTAPHWRQTGEVVRADREAGESIADWLGQEWLQSPFVIRERGRFWMFYGGHASGMTERGEPAAEGDEGMDCQMCLMTSDDGRAWTRHRNDEGLSRVFLGPGETRDPCLIKIGGLWHLYYAGYSDGRRSSPGFFARTSEDLVHWSDWKLVHQSAEQGSGNWDTECPHVVERGGYHYLFRTEDYASARTHVFRSEAPFDFGIGEAGDKYVGPIAVAAPEIIVEGDGDEDGQEYITSNHNLAGGTMLCRLKWVEE